MDSVLPPSSQVRGDPRSINDMRRLVHVAGFKAAVVVSDGLW